MKIVDASAWERRNLGVDVLEISIDRNDALEDVMSELSNVTASYVVLKIASGKVDVLTKVQEEGYVFVENSISLVGNISSINLPLLYQRFIPHVRIEKADNDLSETVLNIIKNGDIFDTDRIALDSCFSKSIAGNRYYNWAKDELSRGADLSVAYYKNKMIAFALVKRIDDKSFDAILGGLFPDARNSGLGFLSIYTGLESIKRLGGTIYETRVSSNNLPILKLHQLLGFSVDDISYILTKHN